MPSLVNTLLKCHSTVRALMNSSAAISGWFARLGASTRIAAAPGRVTSLSTCLVDRTASAGDDGRRRASLAAPQQPPQVLHAARARGCRRTGSGEDDARASGEFRAVLVKELGHRARGAAGDLLEGGGRVVVLAGADRPLARDNPADCGSPLGLITRRERSAISPGALPTLSLPTAAPVDRASRTEPPVLAHTVGALRSHRGYWSADMGTKVMSAAARWLLFCPSGRARLPQTDQDAGSVLKALTVSGSAHAGMP